MLIMKKGLQQNEQNKYKFNEDKVINMVNNHILKPMMLITV